jgi:guanylate kinase
MSSKKAIIFSAPSGAGKTTLVKELLQKISTLSFSISACNRPPRNSEIDGHDYHFLTTESFKQKIKEGAFLEWEEVYSNMFYGTLHSEIDRVWASGKQVIFDVDVQGGVQLKKHFDKQALSIFIAPPSLDILTQRLTNRGTDSNTDIIKRLSKAKEELEYQADFDVVIVNDDLEQSVDRCYKEVSKFLAL